MTNARFGPPDSGSSEPGQWHIITEVPLPVPQPDTSEWLLEGEFIVMDDEPAPQPQASDRNGAAPASKRRPAEAATLWDELDALMRQPQPPVAPANTVFTERYVRRARRRALLRRLRRMCVAALVGALLGMIVWLWAPLGWSHPFARPVALPRLGLARAPDGAPWVVSGEIGANVW